MYQYFKIYLTSFPVYLEKTKKASDHRCTLVRKGSAVSRLNGAVYGAELETPQSSPGMAAFPRSQGPFKLRARNLYDEYSVGLSVR